MKGYPQPGTALGDCGRHHREHCDATPTRTSKMSNCVRCWRHHCIYGNERKNEGQARAYHSERESLMIHSSRNPEVSGKRDAECVQKREANAQRTQAYHSRRESVMASSSRDLEVSGKPDAVFSCLSESSKNHVFRKTNEVVNRETDSGVMFILFLDLLTQQMLGKSLLDGNKDHFLDQARCEFVKQEHQVGPLNNCINELQKQAYAQRLELEDARHG